MKLALKELMTETQSGTVRTPAWGKPDAETESSTVESTAASAEDDAPLIGSRTTSGMRPITDRDVEKLFLSLRSIKESGGIDAVFVNGDRKLIPEETTYHALGSVEVPKLIVYPKNTQEVRTVLQKSHALQQEVGEEKFPITR